MRAIEAKADEIRRRHGKGVQGIPLPSFNDLEAFLGHQSDTAALRYMQDLLKAFWEQLVLYEQLFDKLANFQLLKKDLGEGMMMYFCPLCDGEEAVFEDFFVHAPECFIAQVQQLRAKRQESKA